MVVTLIKHALSSGGCCAVFALDIKDVFINRALANIGVPECLGSLVKNCL